MVLEIMAKVSEVTGVYKKGDTVDKINSFPKASSSKAVLKRSHVDESEGGGCEEMGSSLDLKGGEKWMSTVERILSAAASQTWCYIRII